MIRNVFSDPIVDKIDVNTLIETDRIVIQRVSAQKQKLAPDALGDKGKNNFVLLLRGQLERKDKTKFMPGDFAVVSSETKDEPELVGVAEESVWLSVRFSGKLGKGLFPSPDDAVLKRLKENIKRNVFIPRIDSLVESSHVRVERIAVDGNSSSIADCVSPTNQFVLALEGHVDLGVEHEIAAANTEKDAAEGARLLESQKVKLSSGDFVCIPANARCRVDSSEAEGRTVMLSIYFGGNLSLK
jgi:hypothetical protein